MIKGGQPMGVYKIVQQTGMQRNKVYAILLRLEPKLNKVRVRRRDMVFFEYSLKQL